MRPEGGRHIRRRVQDGRRRGDGDLHPENRGRSGPALSRADAIRTARAGGAFPRAAFLMGFLARDNVLTPPLRKEQTNQQVRNRPTACDVGTMPEDAGGPRIPTFSPVVPGFNLTGDLPMEWMRDNRARAIHGNVARLELSSSEERGCGRRWPDCERFQSAPNLPSPDHTEEVSQSTRPRFHSAQMLSSVMRVHGRSPQPLLTS
jgi:hypothetical protein